MSAGDVFLAYTFLNILTMKDIVEMFHNIHLLRVRLPFYGQNLQYK